MDDIGYRSARQVASDIREGKLSSREHLEALLDRIERLDGPISSVVTIDAERARREAGERDRAVKQDKELGPLHGVAMTVKDSFQTQGMRTTSGALELSGYVPEVDAVPVARLRAAGAVIFGKTNLPVYGGDTQSYNEVFGQTNNPWNIERTPGGSSGGAAAALAAGFTPIELGSDIGGSIRGPASHCGVTGHKPSYGIVPAIGQIPGQPGTLTQADIAVAGPMARDIDDLELGLDILAGPDDWHRTAYRLELPLARHRSLSDYRIAAWFEEPEVPIAADVRARLEEAAIALERAGVRVDRNARPTISFGKAIDTFDRLLAAALSGSAAPEQIEALAACKGDDEVARASRAMATRHRDWLRVNERRLQMRQRWHEFFADWDAVLLPSMPVAAIPHDHTEPMAARTVDVDGIDRSYLDQTRWAGLTGVAFLPATTVPVGRTSEGLPVGIQIAGPFLEDRTTLDVARRLMEIHGGFERPPGF